MLNQRIGKASITPIIYYIIVNSTGAITPLFALVGVQMCLDRRGKGGICAHRGLTHLDEPDIYLAVDDTEIGSGARIPLWMFGFLY